MACAEHSDSSAPVIQKTVLHSTAELVLYSGRRGDYGNVPSFGSRNHVCTGYPVRSAWGHSVARSTKGGLMWITGQVFNEEGEVLAGVTIEASGPPGAPHRVALSNAAGHYVLQDVCRGGYTITFAHPGFSTLRRHTDTHMATFVATINAQLKSTNLRPPSN
jgi:hypothetical protein